MSVFIKEHGRTVVCCAAAVFVLGVVFCIRSGEDKGFIQIAYARAKEDMAHTDFLLYTEAVKTVMARKKPEIVYLYKKILPGETVNIDGMFLARDADGKPAQVEICDILNSLGESILDTEKGCDTKKFLFPVSGIYTLKVKASDKENRTVCKQYKALVSGR